MIGVFDENDLAGSIEKAKHFCFQKLEKGNADMIIRDALAKWFYPHKMI